MVIQKSITPNLLAIFAHRPEKVSSILPYSGVDFRMVVPTIMNKWANKPIVTTTTMHIPENAKYMLHIPYHWKMYRMSKREKYNVFMSHGGIIGFWTWVLARLCRGKFVYRLGGHIYDEADEHAHTRPFIEKKAYGLHFRLALFNIQRADCVIVVTNDMKNRLVIRSGKQQEKISIVTVPCNPGEVSAGTGKVILTVCNVNFRAKLNAMIRFLPSIICVLRDNPDVTYRLVAPGRYRDNLDNWIKHNWPTELSSRLEFMDFIKDVSIEYQKANVFCYFSDLDGCPNVVLEAWSHQLPVIANRCSWSEDLINNKDTGFLAKDAKEAETYLKMLLFDSETRKRVGLSSYEYLCKNHSLKVAGRQIGEILNRVVNE